MDCSFFFIFIFLRNFFSLGQRSQVFSICLKSPKLFYLFLFTLTQKSSKASQVIIPPHPCHHLPPVSTPTAGVCTLTVISAVHLTFLCLLTSAASLSKSKCAQISSCVWVELCTGAVYLHPRRHPGGLSVRRNSHTRVRVQSSLLRADSHRLPDQLVSPEGWVPGKVGPFYLRLFKQWEVVTGSCAESSRIISEKLLTPGKEM